MQKTTDVVSFHAQKMSRSSRFTEQTSSSLGPAVHVPPTGTRKPLGADGNVLKLHLW